MKNPKVLYILIGVFCFLAIVAGVYAEFFVKDVDKNNVIMPNMNHTGDNLANEKTQEELKEHLSNLFTNVVNTADYDFTNIQKINTEKEIVYSAYDIQKQENNYEVDIHLPVFNITGEVPAGFNTITQNVFANKASEVLKSNNSYKTIYHVSYVGYINGDILSLAIKSTLKEGNNPQRVIVQTYHYNLATGKEVNFLDCLTQVGLSQAEVQTKIQTTVKQAADEANILLQSGYSVYIRDLNSTMYQVPNISTFLLGPNGSLYAIFAYGNQNFTSEMDVVLFE